MAQSGTMLPDMWEAAFLFSTEAIFVADTDSKLSCWSEPFGQLVGRDARPGVRLSTLVHEEDQKTFDTAWTQAQTATAAPVVLHLRFMTSKGLFAPLTCVLRRAPQGGQIFGSLRQVSHEVARAIGSKRGDPADILRVLSANLPVTVWAINKDGTLTHHEGKAAEAMGVKPGQLVGMSAFEVFRDAADELEWVKRALQGVPVHAHTSKYDTFWESWMVPSQDADGNVEAVIGLSLDVTEAKKTEEELRMRLQQIQKQQEIIGKLSTPIVQVWEGVVALPMIGVVDSVRTADVMQNLLDEIVRTGAHYAILDLTGVEMVDTQVANHLIKLVSAIRLLGAGGIVCGIRPSVAQTIVELGLDMTSVVTRANLKAGIMFCIGQMRRLEQTTNGRAGAPSGG